MLTLLSFSFVLLLLTSMSNALPNSNLISLRYSNATVTRHKFTVIRSMNGYRIIKFRKNDQMRPNATEVYLYSTDMVDTLYPNGRTEANNTSIFHILSNGDNEKAFRASTVPYTWYPVGCHILGYSFHRIEAIVDDKDTKVWLVRETNSGEIYIWKRYTSFSHYSAEIAFLSVADHPNLAKAVCTLMETSKSPTKYASVILEVVRGMSSGKLFSQLNSTDRDQYIVHASAEIFDALKYIHWLGYTHGDVKPSNIIINHEGRAILIDFGFVLPVNYFKRAQGTPNTIAPELLGFTPDTVAGELTLPLAENSDWFSFGQTIVQWMSTNYRDEKGKDFAATKLWSSHYELRDYPLHLLREKNLRQLLYYLLNPTHKLRLFNTRQQLQWIEKLPFWSHIDFAAMQSVWEL